jgi:hypothetical protein
MIIVLLLTRGAAARACGIAIAATAVSLLLASGACCPAFAQAVPSRRVAVDLTVGSAAPATTFTQSVTFEQYSETGSLTSAYSAPHTLSIDGGVTVRLWHGLGVEVAGSHFRASGDAQVAASIPNPLVFNQPRDISGTAPLTHAENVVHVDAAYWIQIAPKLSVIVSGGPSFFRVTQDFVTDVTYSETFPYTTATYESADTTTEHGSATGFNVAVGAGYRLFHGLSIVGAVRFSRSHVSFADALTNPMPVGSLHVGGGVRYEF